MNKPTIVASRVRPQMSKSTVPGITKADLMGLFVDGAFDSKLRTSAHRALNKQLGLYPDSNGEFTADQVERLLDAARQYMADPANQVDLTRPMLVRKSTSGQSAERPDLARKALNDHERCVHAKAAT